MYLLVVHNGTCAVSGESFTVGLKPVSNDASTFISLKTFYDMTGFDFIKNASSLTPRQVDFVSNLSKLIYQNVGALKGNRILPVLEDVVAEEVSKDGKEMRWVTRLGSNYSTKGEGIVFDSRLRPTLLNIIFYHQSYFRILSDVESRVKHKRTRSVLTVKYADKCSVCGDTPTAKGYGVYFADLTVSGLDNMIKCKKCAVRDDLKPGSRKEYGRDVVVTDKLMGLVLSSGVLSELHNLLGFSVDRFEEEFNKMSEVYKSRIDLCEVVGSLKETKEKSNYWWGSKLIFNYITFRGIAVSDKELRYLFPQN